MKIKSLIRENESLVLAEVEITLLPGLPQIQFLGLPDQNIRESVHRIKSALKMQNFELPRTRQILVNIRPHHLKKSSRGLELAVAAGILWKTEQLRPPTHLERLIVYGELGLEGDVAEPEDLPLHFENDLPAMTVLSGLSSLKHLPFRRFQIAELKNLNSPQICEASEERDVFLRPDNFSQFHFPPVQARLLEIAALGGHSVLLAGPAGSGKTTLAKVLSELMTMPGASEIKQIKKYARAPINWRPVVQPHHSSTPLALIGGGVPPSRGEFSRAHLGMLILDEFLEFPLKAQEALREPMEEGVLRISRGSHAVEFLAKAQVVACTNLCPCGDWVPQARVRCSRSLRRCKDYVNRLSGPLTDRFQILFFTEKYKHAGGVKGEEIFRRVETARAFRAARPRFGDPGLRPNADEVREVLLQTMDPFVAKHLLPQEFSSRRRELATLRVARSIADLEGAAIIGKKHLEEALQFAWRNFERMKTLD